MAKYTISKRVEGKIQEDLEVRKKELRSGIRVEEIVIPQQLATYTDEKRGVKSVAFPFQLPDGNNGIITITRLKTGEWIPSNDIKKIELHLIR